jgi:hypothetical protein
MSGHSSDLSKGHTKDLAQNQWAAALCLANGHLAGRLLGKVRQTAISGPTTGSTSGTTPAFACTQCQMCRKIKHGSVTRGIRTRWCC